MTVLYPTQGPEKGRFRGGLDMTPAQRSATSARLIPALIGLTLLACAGSAHSQVPGLTFGLGAATDYRSKGVSKTGDDGYVFGTVDWKSSNGQFYAGVAAATVDSPIGASYETDLKAGWRPKLGGWDLDFTAFYRAFPDSNPGADDDYVEFRAQASRAFGPVTLRGLVWHTPDNVGAVEAATWSEARATWKVHPRVRASGSFGYHDQDNGPSYSAWNAGLAFDVAPKTELDVRWYDTDAHASGDRYDGELVAALGFKF